MNVQSCSTQIYSSSNNITEFVDILPQIVFAHSWTSAIFLTNLQNSQGEKVIFKKKKTNSYFLFFEKKKFGVNFSFV